MVKVECVVAYNDLQLNKLVNIGEVLDVTKERAEVLTNLGLAKVLEVTEEEVKAPEEVQAPVEEEKKPVPKKKRK